MVILSTVAGDDRVKYSRLIWVLCKGLSPLPVSAHLLLILINTSLHLPHLLSPKPSSSRQEEAGRKWPRRSLSGDLAALRQQRAEGRPSRAANPLMPPALAPTSCVSSERSPGLSGTQPSHRERRGLVSMRGHNRTAFTWVPGRPQCPGGSGRDGGRRGRPRPDAGQPPLLSSRPCFPETRASAAGFSSSQGKPKPSVFK